MSYSAPDHWQHGDEPTAAAMNKYSDSLEALHAILGDAARHYLVPQNFDVEEPSLDHGFYGVHRLRWLIYRGDGELVDPSGAGATITLSGNGAAWIAYDLDGVEWMTPGRLYQLKDVIVAFENDNTTGVSEII